MVECLSQTDVSTAKPLHKAHGQRRGKVEYLLKDSVFDISLGDCMHKLHAYGCPKKTCVCVYVCVHVTIILKEISTGFIGESNHTFLNKPILKHGVHG